ncbi:uncharacterized protein [Labrus bergylta]|uniref:uncharacterized protein isoform X1 n=1 Tax=Labrus bergylta TaxID=56723 RepID=UPI0033134F20
MENKRRNAYDAAFKLKAVNLAVKEGNRAAALSLSINESMVRHWKRQREELSQCKKSKKAFRGNKSRWPELEDFLEDWVNTQRADGRGVSTVQIRLKAKTVATEMKIENFRGGPSWCFRFMRRKGLSIRAGTTQQLPPDYQEQITNSGESTQRKIEEYSIGKDQIINMDEVPLTSSSSHLFPDNPLCARTLTNEYTIHKCGLQCRKQCHYHCLYCTATLIRKKDFKKHLLTCHKVHRPDVQGSTQAEGLMAPLLITEAFEFSSQGMRNHDGFEDLHMSTDSDDQNSHEASSSHGFTIRDCGYEPEKPVSFKRHQTVQTNFDKPQDCDEFYFMNLAKLFKKLSAPKKADVRMKIERILLEAGFE